MGWWIQMSSDERWSLASPVRGEMESHQVIRTLDYRLVRVKSEIMSTISEYDFRVILSTITSSFNRSIGLCSL
jgi:hypothetical protein